MHYFIDGYNLLFRLLRAGDDLHNQRELIIREIGSKIQVLGLDATLVFDAHYQVGEANRSHLQNLEVLFTAEGESADEFIINELKCIADPRQETVVTSDKKLAWRARRKAAHSESVEEFVEWLGRRYKNKIRTIRKAKKSVPLAPPPAAPAKKNEAPPNRQARPEECMEYYEDVFERAYEQLAKDEPNKAASSSSTNERKTNKQLKGIKREAIRAEDPRTDEERWLEIFEQRLNQTNS